MAPTTAAVKRHPEGRKTTHSTTSKSDCIALFREKVQALLPAPRSATGPGQGEFLSRVCRTTSDGYVHIIQMERYSPTEAGEEEILAVIDMEGHQSLFEPPAPSTTTRRAVRASTKSRTQASNAKAAAAHHANDDDEYQPRPKSRARSGASSVSSSTIRSSRTQRGRKSTATPTAHSHSASDAPSRRTRRTEKDLDELCGLVDDLDVVSNMGAASACGSEATRVSEGAPQARQGASQTA